MNYQLRKSQRARNISISIKANGQVILTCPHFCPTKKAEEFLLLKEGWIKKKIAFLKSKKSAINYQQVNIFGKKYQITLLNDHSQNYGIKIINEIVQINQLNTQNINHPPAKMPVLIRFLKNTAEKYLIPRTHQLAKKMKISFQKISLRSQETRWGSCSSLGNLNFNWRLIHYHPEIIDYVIIHELAHRRQMNHSARFWQLVAQYDPSYQQHRGFLKRNGFLID